MEILSTAVYVGPNVYARLPLIRLTVDLHRRAETPVSHYGDALMRPLLEHLPGLASAKTEQGEPFLGRIKEEDCHLGELMAQVAVALQNHAGAPADAAMTRPAAHADEVEVLYGYEFEEVGIEAGDVARAILIELIAPREDEPYDIGEAIEDFDRYAGRRALGPSALALVRAADARDIPWVRMNDASLIQVGQGKYQKRIEAALTSQTSHTAVEIAADKELCARLLAELGLPVPKQYHVRDAEDAVDAANHIGYPVVVKPIDGNHGRGVSVNLTSDAEVADAFEVALGEGSGVVVESMIQGDDHRLLVIDGKLVAAAHRVPGHVVGDGTRTIAELVDIVNQDPRRGAGHENMLTRLDLDDTADRPCSRPRATATTACRRRARWSTCARPPTSRPAAPPST